MLVACSANLIAAALNSGDPSPKVKNSDFIFVILLTLSSIRDTHCVECHLKVVLIYLALLN